jgi:hypothetical protein
VARREEKGNACRVLAGKSERNRSLGRLTRIWKDNVKIRRRKEMYRGCWRGNLTEIDLRED